MLFLGNCCPGFLIFLFFLTVTVRLMRLDDQYHIKPNFKCLLMHYVQSTNSICVICQLGVSASPKPNTSQSFHRTCFRKVGLVCPPPLSQFSWFTLLPNSSSFYLLELSFSQLPPTSLEHLFLQKTQTDALIFDCRS